MSVLLNNISDVDAPPSRDTLAYFALYPDVADAFANNNYGLSADEFARIHYENYGQYEQRAPVDRQALFNALPSMAQDQQQAVLSEAYRDVGPITRVENEYADPSWRQGASWENDPNIVQYRTGTNNIQFYPTETGYQAALSPVFDQPGAGGQYGFYSGNFDPSGRLQNVSWQQAERSGSWLEEHPMAPFLALATLGAMPVGTETLASAAAGTPELVIGGGAYAGAAPTASLSSLSTAAGFVEGAGELFTTDLATANNVVNTVANNPVMTAVADATPQTLESMAANAGTSFNVPGVGEAVSNAQQMFNQGSDFLRNMWNDIGRTLLPDAPPQVQRAVGEVAVRTAATGGDFERALQDTGLSFLTSGLGNQVADVTGSPMAGRLASNAAQQYARTGTVDPAQLAAGEATRFLQGEVSQATGSPLVGNVAASVARDVMAGRDPTTGLINIGTGALLNQAGSTLDRFLPGSTQDQASGDAAPIENRTAPPGGQPLFGQRTDGIGLRDVTAAYIGSELQRQNAPTGGQPAPQPAPRTPPPRNQPPAQVDISTLQRVPAGNVPPIPGTVPTGQTPTGQVPTGQTTTGQGNITQPTGSITGATSLSDILATMRT